MARAILDDTDAALAAGEEALAIARDLGYVTQIAGSLAALGFAWGAPISSAVSHFSMRVLH